MSEKPGNPLFDAADEDQEPMNYFELYKSYNQKINSFFAETGYNSKIIMDRQFSTDILLYGHLGSGDYVGHYVRFKGKPVEGYEFLSTQLGVVVGQLHGAIVVFYDQFFFGWVDKNEFELLNIVQPYIYKGYESLH